jgi:hypothetical protein
VGDIGEFADRIGGAGQCEVPVVGDVGASMPSKAGAHVAGCSQSNRTSLEREASLTGMPAVRGRSTTRRPVLPVAPMTSVVRCIGSVWVLVSWLLLFSIGSMMRISIGQGHR